MAQLGLAAAHLPHVDGLPAEGDQHFSQASIGRAQGTEPRLDQEPGEQDVAIDLVPISIVVRKDARHRIAHRVVGLFTAQLIVRAVRGRGP